MDLVRIGWGCSADRISKVSSLLRRWLYTLAELLQQQRILMWNGPRIHFHYLKWGGSIGKLMSVLLLHVLWNQQLTFWLLYLTTTSLSIQTKELPEVYEDGAGHKAATLQMNTAESMKTFILRNGLCSVEVLCLEWRSSWQHCGTTVFLYLSHAIATINGYISSN